MPSSPSKLFKLAAALLLTSSDIAATLSAVVPLRLTYKNVARQLSISRMHHVLVATSKLAIAV
jgi:hypothetical protein